MNEYQGKQALRQILLVIKRHFPSLPEDLSGLADHRKKPQYEVDEIYMACISMFLMKEKSRNAQNNARDKGSYQENYSRLYWYDSFYNYPLFDVLFESFHQVDHRAFDLYDVIQQVSHLHQ